MALVACAFNSSGEALFVHPLKDPWQGLAPADAFRQLVRERVSGRPGGGLGKDLSVGLTGLGCDQQVVLPQLRSGSWRDVKHPLRAVHGDVDLCLSRVDELGGKRGLPTVGPERVAIGGQPLDRGPHVGGGGPLQEIVDFRMLHIDRLGEIAHLPPTAWTVRARPAVKR